MREGLPEQRAPRSRATARVCRRPSFANLQSMWRMRKPGRTAVKRARRKRHRGRAELRGSRTPSDRIPTSPVRNRGRQLRPQGIWTNHRDRNQGQVSSDLWRISGRKRSILDPQGISADTILYECISSIHPPIFEHPMKRAIILFDNLLIGWLPDCLGGWI